MTKLTHSKIPTIIHQVWEGRNGDKPDKLLLELAKTWRIKNPNWEYRLWGFKEIDEFLLEYFPWFIDNYHSFPYDVQRWDAIRYLILFKFGGIYVDIDYECLEPLTWVQKAKSCCIGLDPPEHCHIFNKPHIISNALMAVTPEHEFFKLIIDALIGCQSNAHDKFNFVLDTTGPYMLNRVYESYYDKDQIWLIPSNLTSPLSKDEVGMLIKGRISDKIEEKIEKAYAVHYFFGSWYLDINSEKCKHLK